MKIEFGKCQSGNLWSGKRRWTDDRNHGKLELTLIVVFSTCSAGKGTGEL